MFASGMRFLVKRSIESTLIMLQFLGERVFQRDMKSKNHGGEAFKIIFCRFTDALFVFFDMRFTCC